MDSISFSIPGKPFGWQRVAPSARIVGKGADQRAIATMHDTRENLDAKGEIKRLYKIAARGHNTKSGPVMLRLVAVFPTPESWPRATQKLAQQGKVWHVGKPDLDNIEKLILDALNKLAWADDGQVAMVQKAKRYGNPARVEVTITALEQPPEAVTPGQKRLEKRVVKEGWDEVLAKKPRKKRDPAADLPSRISVADFRKLNAKSRVAERQKK